jgi:hypothetical protein
VRWQYKNIYEEKFIMRIHNFFFLFATIAVFIGCSSQTYVMMEGYQGKKIHARQLAIAPYSVTILNKDDVIDDLGKGVAEEVFQVYADSIFSSTMKKNSHIDSVMISHNKLGEPLIERKLPLDEEELIKLQLPKESETLFIDSLKPEYILFINNYTIERSRGASGEWSHEDSRTGRIDQTPTYSGGGDPGGLLHQLNFCIWDNTKGKLVSYGRVDVKSPMLFGMSRGHWKDCLQKVALRILMASPFQAIKNEW